MNAECELLASIYRSFNDRNIEAVLAVMDPAVDWPNGMEGGREHGREAVRAYWTRQWSLINPRVDPTGFETDAAGKTVVQVHQVVHDLSGKLLDDKMVQHVYTFRDGLIQTMEIRPCPEDS